MRFYLAASYGRREEIRRYADDLVADGHTVTSAWVFIPNEALDNGAREALLHEPQNVAKAAALAHENMRQIVEAQIFMMFPGGTGRGGRHVEMGIALASGMRVWVVGDPYPETLFQRHRMVANFPDWPGVRAYVRAMMEAGV